MRGVRMLGWMQMAVVYVPDGETSERVMFSNPDHVKDRIKGILSSGARVVRVEKRVMDKSDPANPKSAWVDVTEDYDVKI